MNWTKRLEILANVVIILLAVILGVVLVKKFFLSPSIQTLKSGETISSRDLNFEKADKTVLIALQPDCPFCTASANFYNELKKKTAGDFKINLIALFSKDVTNENDYLERINLKFNEVKKISFDELKIEVTPTLIVVKKDGIVESVWTGKLNSDKEKDFVEKLFEN